MTPEAFRALVLSFPRCRERQGLGAREYRVRDRAFATLGWPQDGWVTVRVPPAEQAILLADDLTWQAIPGRPGVVRLPLADLEEENLRPVLSAAWRMAASLD